MPWPSVQVQVGDIIQASQLNLLPIQIADSTLSASASSFDFTSLPGQFAHLMIVAYLRGDAATDEGSCFVRFNNDSAADYLYETLSVLNANAPSGALISAQTSGKLGTTSAGSAIANTFSSVDAIVPNYAGSSNHKHWRSVATAITGANGAIDIIGGRWGTTSAINRVTILPGSGSFVSGSRCTVYGLA